MQHVGLGVSTHFQNVNKTQSGLFPQDRRLISSDKLVFSGQAPHAPHSTPVDAIQDKMELYQGKLPNCQFLGALLMALQQDPEALKKLMQKSPDGSYTVRFPGAPDCPVMVTPQDYAPLPWKTNLKAEQVKGMEATRVIEAAYAKVLKTLHPDRFQEPKLQRIRAFFLSLLQKLVPKPIRTFFTSVLQKLFPKRFGAFTPPSVRDVFKSFDFDTELFTSAYAYKMLTGHEATIYVKGDADGQIEQQRRSQFKAWGIDWRKSILSEKHHETDQYDQIVMEQLQLAAMRPGQYSIAFVSNPKGDLPELNWLDWGETVRGYHVFVVDKDGIDWQKQTITILDPHNTRVARVIPLEDTLKYFFKMYVAENNSNTPLAETSAQAGI